MLLSRLPIFKQLDDLKAEKDALQTSPNDTHQRILQKYFLDWNYHSNIIEIPTQKTIIHIAIHVGNGTIRAMPCSTMTGK